MRATSRTRYLQRDLLSAKGVEAMGHGLVGEEGPCMCSTDVSSHTWAPGCVEAAGRWLAEERGRRRAGPAFEGREREERASIIST